MKTASRTPTHRAVRLGDMTFGEPLRDGMSVQVWACGDEVRGEAINPDDGIPGVRLGRAAGTAADGDVVVFTVYAKPACLT